MNYQDYCFHASRYKKSSSSWNGRWSTTAHFLHSEKPAAPIECGVNFDHFSKQRCLAYCLWRRKLSNRHSWCFSEAYDGQNCSPTGSGRICSHDRGKNSSSSVLLRNYTTFAPVHFRNRIGKHFIFERIGRSCFVTFRVPLRSSRRIIY